MVGEKWMNDKVNAEDLGLHPSLQNIPRHLNDRIQQEQGVLLVQNMPRVQQLGHRWTACYLLWSVGARTEIRNLKNALIDNLLSTWSVILREQ